MVTVYVWNFMGKNIAWGHASMHCEQTYISWWPTGEGRVPSKISQSVYAASPFRNQTFQTDQLFEGDGKFLKAPDHSIRISGLDEVAIKNWWAGFGLVRNGALLQGPLPAWTSLGQNCSTVVAKALSIGGGDKYASWYSRTSVIWTPNKIREYAVEIQRNIGRKK